MGCSKTVRLMGIMGNNEQGCFRQPMVTKRELKSCSYSAGLECCCSRNIMHTLDTLEISKEKRDIMKISFIKVILRAIGSLTPLP